MTQYSDAAILGTATIFGDATRQELLDVAWDHDVLTCERAESSYGQPVLVLDGQAYGPADTVEGAITAAEYVNRQVNGLVRYNYDLCDPNGLVARFLRMPA